MGKWKTYEIPKDNQTRQKIHALKPGYGLPRNKDKTHAEWAQKGAKLQAARRDSGIHKVLTNDKDYFKVTADTRLKLEKDTALALPCIVRKTVGENLRLEQLKQYGAVSFRKKASGTSENTLITLPKKVMWKVSPWPGT